MSTDLKSKALFQIRIWSDYCVTYTIAKGGGLCLHKGGLANMIRIYENYGIWFFYDYKQG